jgi:hypothetical protein
MIEDWTGVSSFTQENSALRLRELACDLARAGIRRQQPDADRATVERLLRERARISRQ